jgi:hypothetical protein
MHLLGRAINLLRSPQMKRFLRSAFLSACLASIQGCVTDSRPGPSSSGADTLEVFPNGERMPRMPRVDYRTHDSLVYLRILGTEYGEEDEYWVYRNDSLLEQPLNDGWISSGPDSGYYLYSLVDHLDSAGHYTYHARYGYSKYRLSRPSPAFTYRYPGRSPSGSVALELGPDQLVRITLEQPPSEIFAQACFERKIGADGTPSVLDTVVKGGSPAIELLDTAFIFLDTMVYYRAVSMDARSETWLEPTSWDSIEVANRTWNFLPAVNLRSLGTEVRAEISNTLEYSGKAWYFLYRNSSAAKEGRAKVDSVEMRGIAKLSLRDTSSRPATYFYWVEARDPYGRGSLRSPPRTATFTGIPRGPDILGSTVYADFIRIRAARDAKAAAYALFRAQDTGKPEILVDSLSADPSGNAPAFVDVPPGDGRWYYRVASLIDGKSSTPGDWHLTDYFRYQPSYALLPTSIVNRGAQGVEATIEPRPDTWYRLYRSRNQDGSDSIAVDSLSASDTRIVLKDMPPLGTWYYRAVRFEKPGISSGTILRTELTRIDYTGRPAGPEIRSITNYGGGVEVIFGHSPDAVAYVVERSPDTSNAWSAADTVPIGESGNTAFFDRPPKDGFWSYRARTLLGNLALTDPGPAMRTRSAWTYSVSYGNTLLASIANRGPRVECVLTTVSSFGYYLKRSPLGDYSNPTAVDSIQKGSSRTTLEDAPPEGIHYYWVERMTVESRFSNTILRSAPVKVEFTGAPEVLSLTPSPRGVQVRYAALAIGDTLEIWGGSGASIDSASFVLKASATADAFPSMYEDADVDTENSGFYHYRLALRRAGGTTGKGPIKTLYHQP